MPNDGKTTTDVYQRFPRYNFVARHGVFHSRMFSSIGQNFQFCCNRYRLRACDLVNRAHYEHVIDKASTDRLDHSVQCCADIIRELVMVIREGLLVLSDSIELVKMTFVRP